MTQKLNIILHTDICWLQTSEQAFFIEIEVSIRQRLERIEEYCEHYKLTPINYIFSISLYNDVNKTLQDAFINRQILVRIVEILSRLDPERDGQWILMLIYEEKGEMEVFTAIEYSDLACEVQEIIKNLRSIEHYKNHLMAGDRNIFYPLSYFTSNFCYVPLDQ